MSPPDVPAPARIAPVRYADDHARCFAGLRRTHPMATAGESIPGQWGEFSARGDVPGAIAPEVYYGIVCGADREHGTLEYMCACEVAALEAVPAGWDRLRTPDAHYAVFEHHGPIDGIAATWAAIHAWLPGSGRRAAWTPDFERYDERFCVDGADSVVEIWFPMERAPGGGA